MSKRNNSTTSLASFDALTTYEPNAGEPSTRRGSKVDTIFEHTSTDATAVNTPQSPRSLEEASLKDVPLAGEDDNSKQQWLPAQQNADEKATAENSEKPEEQQTLDVPEHGRLLPLRQFLLSYACLAACIFLTALDQTIVACVVPTISQDFGSESTSWVGICYLLTQTVFSPIYGRLSDVFGRKPLFLAAQAIFFCGLIICALAPSMTVLLLGRSIAGVGGAGLFSMVQITVSDIVALHKRGVYHGMLSSLNGLGSAIGPTLGGVLVGTSVRWRMAFFFEMPIAFLAFVGTVFFLPSTGKSDMRMLSAKLKTIDYLGMVLFLGGTTSLLIGITFIQPPEITFASPTVIAPFIVGICVLVIFFIWESKGAIQPIMNPKVFRNIDLDCVLLMNFIFGYLFYAALYYLPEFFQVVGGQDAVQSSVTIIPLTISSVAISWGSGLMVSYLGTYKWSLMLSFFLQVIATVVLYVFFRPGVESYQTILIMLLLGIGFGCLMQCTLVATQACTSEKEVAFATSVRNFFRNGGGVVGLAASSAVKSSVMPSAFRRLFNGALPQSTLMAFQDDPLSIADMFPDPQDPMRLLAVQGYGQALEIVFVVFIPLAALGLVTSVVLREYSLRRDQLGNPIRNHGWGTALKKRFFPRRSCSSDQSPAAAAAVAEKA